jgi:hypothetical protein
VDVEQAGKIINAVSEGWHVVCVAVPTRALRLIRDDAAIKFRVEQLNPTPPQLWQWKPVSTHNGDEPWESLGPGIQDMINKQARLKEKIKLAQHDARMAQIRAENPLSV